MPPETLRAALAALELVLALKRNAAREAGDREMARAFDEAHALCGALNIPDDPAAVFEQYLRGWGGCDGDACRAYNHFLDGLGRPQIPFDELAPRVAAEHRALMKETTETCGAAGEPLPPGLVPPEAAELRDAA